MVVMSYQIGILVVMGWNSARSQIISLSHARNVMKHNNRRAVWQRTAKETAHQNSKDQNVLIIAVENQPITAKHHALQVTGNPSNSLPDKD